MRPRLLSAAFCALLVVVTCLAVLPLAAFTHPGAPASAMANEWALAPQNHRIPVNALVASGYARLAGSPSDIGRLRDVFDESSSTLYRSANVNPAFIQVTFNRAVTYTGFQTYFSNAFGDPAYQSRVATADSQSDMDVKQGSYREVVPWTPTASDSVSRVPLATPVTAKLVRLTVERLTGDDFVHINDWQIRGESPFVDVLSAPRGVAIDSTGRALVAESGADRIAVFAPDGVRQAGFGSTGSANGQFRSPWDVAVDPNRRIYVADRDNSRVQIFGAGGTFVRKFGGAGTSAGRFSKPQGVSIDAATGKVYVADTGNHRVQRFLPNGSLDATWGGDGIVGTTATIQRNHTGFDRPTDVAINPVTRAVYVADYGNQRMEVFNKAGTYLRTYLAVYRANGLAFDATGNLYVAGEDPNDDYTAFDGRLRFLKAGEQLISRHYTGGLDDIGRIEGGVAVRRNGKILFTDVLRGRVVATGPSFAEPLSGPSIDGNGTGVTFRWRTKQPSSGSVRLGDKPFRGTVATDPVVGRQHDVTVTGLTPNSRLYYQVSFPDPFTAKRRFTLPDVLNTGASSGRSQFLRLKAVGVIYTDTQAGPGYVAMDPSTLAAARRRFERIADFYWRNSGFRLWLDIQLVEVNRDITESSIDPFSAMEPDLSALGFSSADDLDAAWGTSTLAPGNNGGTAALFGRLVAMSRWVTQSDFVGVHEVNHSIDSLYATSDLAKFEFNHGIWAVPNGVGHALEQGLGFAVNGQILRNMLGVNFTATKAPFTKIRTAPDADGDTVPDTSPPGLTTPLSITESTLGSSASREDTDGDGLEDLGEATALTFHNTNPSAADSDGDGKQDDVDRNPAYRMKSQVARGAPTVDGAITPAEPWTVVTRQWGFSNDALVPDSNSVQDRVTTYAAWDDHYLFLGLRGPETVTRVYLDGRADNQFRSADNYYLTMANGFFRREVKINVGVPDLFRQIDDHGQFSEFFDTDPRFTLPYNGRPILDHPGEGLGFSGRLVTEGDLLYERGGMGDSSVWEVAIPWSQATSFRGFSGKEMAIAFDVGGDLLFETDHSARIRLAP
jgi:DNA-binding beta-propeller fold protein YncE